MSIFANKNIERGIEIGVSLAVPIDDDDVDKHNIHYEFNGMKHAVPRLADLKIFPRFLVHHAKDYSTAHEDKNPNCDNIPPSFYNVVFAPEKRICS